MEVWKFIQQKLAAGQDVMLLYVLQSEGSSPGRQGFTMAVAGDDDFCGTIGGGIMEHKLVEKAKMLLLRKEAAVSVQQQYHDKEKTTDQSGMICSGSQLNAFIPLTSADTDSVEEIIRAAKRTVQLSPQGLRVTDEAAGGLQFQTNTDWVYTEAVNRQPLIHIIGGGHVGLALSELMRYLGFYIKIYDDRPGLNTLAANTFAHEKCIVSYDDMAGHFSRAEKDYVVIMTIGYRTDKAILQQLMPLPFRYLGLLGSENKIEILKKELLAEGYPAAALEKVHAPIGINILSKTTKEIAVSIAAEIIREKNKDLPTGRHTGL